MRIFVKAVFILIVLTFNSTLLLAQDSIIKVKIIGIEELGGDIFIGLFNSSDGFPNRNDNAIGTNIKAECDSVEYVFDHLLEGDYAIAVYHDKNKNEKLDKNFLGIPTENYMFSNYATGNFGPPSFEDAKFTLIDSLMIVLDFQKNN